MTTAALAVAVTRPETVRTAHPLPAVRSSRLLTVGIVGAGHTGLGLGSLWAAAGHPVLLGNCKGSCKMHAVLKHGTDAFENVLPAEAVSRADVIVLGAAPRHLEAYLGALGSLAGKIVVDPYGDHQRTDSGELVRELVARMLPDAHVVRAFNTVSWTFEAPAFRSPWEREELEFAGDDATAKAVVAKLITSLGLVPRDLGGLANAGMARGLVHLPAHGA